MNDILNKWNNHTSLVFHEGTKYYNTVFIHACSSCKMVFCTINIFNFFIDKKNNFKKIRFLIIIVSRIELKQQIFFCNAKTWLSIINAQILINLELTWKFYALISLKHIHFVLKSSILHIMFLKWIKLTTPI